jgi:probable rRNA maturation factor
MGKQNVLFFSEDVQYTIRGKQKIRLWLSEVIRHEKKKPGNISVVLCSDRYLLQLNKKFLKHDYYTDIITFDYGEDKTVSGDIMISIERVKENAASFKVPVSSELLRVIVHGVLHLCGYQDKNKNDRGIMTELENKYLLQYKSL